MQAQVVSFTCPPTSHGSRLDLALVAWSKQLPLDSPYHGWSRHRWLGLVRQGFVFLQDHCCKKGSTLVAAGDRILVQRPMIDLGLQSAAEPLSAEHVLYEDEHLIVLNKPADMVIHGGAGIVGPTLVDRIRATWPAIPDVTGLDRPGLVHRLDRGTSGILLLGKTAHAQQCLSEQFAKRAVQKVYLACVHGTPKPAAQQLVTYYGRHPSKRQCFTGRFPSKRQAMTSFRCLGSGHGASWLQVRLHTGRTHQIRVHLSELGHPLLGDGLYGKQQRAAPALAYQANRQALHALSIVVQHPVSKRWCGFVAPLPADLLGLWGKIVGDCQPELFAPWTGVAHTGHKSVGAA